MLRWAHLTAVIVFAVVLSAILIVFLRRWFCLRRPESSSTLNETRPIRSDSFQARVSKLHQTSLIHQRDTSDIKRRGNINNYSVSRTGGGFPSKPGLFNWIDHPALVSEAVENGWTRFGFGVRHAPAAAKSALLGLCTTAGVGCSGNEDPGVVITWEVSNGSVDFSQTIKFNQAFRETVNAKPRLVVLRASLPLPGPPLVSSAFPREAYFEITLLEILSRRDGFDASVESEQTKLFKSQEPKLVKTREWDVKKEEEAVLSLGLATGGSLTGGDTRLPGQFPASIGFQSDGAVYLDGMKLVGESEKHEWAKEKKVIGCGYDPRKKKVYFTVNSHLVHVINCKAEEFGTPLYPILASNTEATLLVNLGQSPFYYGQANTHRVPNPCFVGPGLRPSAGAAPGLEDSKELFSIGRLDSQYLNNIFINRENSTDEIASGRATVGYSNRRKLYYDEESDDADLFEIALERSGKQNPAHFTPRT